MNHKSLKRLFIQIVALVVTPGLMVGPAMASTPSDLRSPVQRAGIADIFAEQTLMPVPYMTSSGRMNKRTFLTIAASVGTLGTLVLAGCGTSPAARQEKVLRQYVAAFQLQSEGLNDQADQALIAAARAARGLGAEWEDPLNQFTQGYVTLLRVGVYGGAEARNLELTRIIQDLNDQLLVSKGWLFIPSGQAIHFSVARLNEKKSEAVRVGEAVHISPEGVRDVRRVTVYKGTLIGLGDPETEGGSMIALGSPGRQFLFVNEGRIAQRDQGLKTAVEDGQGQIRQWMRSILTQEGWCSNGHLDPRFLAEWLKKSYLHEAVHVFNVVGISQIGYQEAYAHLIDAQQGVSPRLSILEISQLANHEMAANQNTDVEFDEIKDRNTQYFTWTLYAMAVGLGDAELAKRIKRRQQGSAEAFDRAVMDKKPPEIDAILNRAREYIVQSLLPGEALSARGRFEFKIVNGTQGLTAPSGRRAGLAVPSRSMRWAAVLAFGGKLNTNRRRFMAAVGALSTPVSAQTPQAAPRTTPPARSAPTRPLIPAPRFPAVDLDRATDKLYVRDQLLAALDALGDFNREIPRMAFTFGYMPKDMQTAVADFRQFLVNLKEEDIEHFPATSGQAIGVIHGRTRKQLFYNPLSVRQIFMAPDAYLIHEITHFLKPQVARTDRLRTLSSDTADFFLHHLNPQAISLFLQKGGVLSLDAIFGEELWDRSAISRDETAYNQIREVVGIHWLMELEANYMVVAMLAARSTGDKASQLAVARQFIARAPTFRRDFLRLATDYQGGQGNQLPLSFVVAGFTDVLASRTMVDFVIDLYQRKNLGFTRDFYESHTNDPTMYQPLVTWAISEIYLPTLKSDAAFQRTLRGRFDDLRRYFDGFGGHPVMGRDPTQIAA